MLTLCFSCLLCCPLHGGQNTAANRLSLASTAMQKRPSHTTSAHHSARLVSCPRAHNREGSGAVLERARAMLFTDTAVCKLGLPPSDCFDGSCRTIASISFQASPTVFVSKHTPWPSTRITDADVG